MKVPLDWLREYLPTKLTPLEIAHQLTSIGLEVDEVQETVLELSLTPNLAHCASIRGVARELAGLLGEKLSTPNRPTASVQGSSIHSQITVRVDNPVACPRYACCILTDVQIGPSPLWLQQRLEACGMRSVNNVVDSTNLVLLELGHPLHAFDLNSIEGKQLIIRNAKSGETLSILDGQQYSLNEEILVICDAKQPIALAGIMGGLQSGISEKTTTVLLEAAYFDPQQIRHTTKQLGVHSEASYRFERGCDPQGVLEALEKGAALICSLTRASRLPETIDLQSSSFAPLKIVCRLSRINKLLGTQLAMSEVETLCQRAGLQWLSSQEDLCTIQAPTYRHDLKQEIDVIEEVARFYGYSHIHKKERAYFRTGELSFSEEYLFSRRIRYSLIAEGLQEFLTCDLISPTQAALISTDHFPTRTQIKLLNPRSLEQSIMRPSMLPSMLSILKYNADHGVDSLAGFEVGRVHFSAKERFLEPLALSLVMTGERTPFHWETKGKKADFFDLKGILENLFLDLKLSNYRFVPSSYSNFHPGRQATIFISEMQVGIMGEVHPLTLKKGGVEAAAYFAELSLEDLLPFLPTQIKMEPLPLFPSSTRDWTVTVAEALPIDKIFHWIEKECSSFLESYSLLDVYKSDALGSDRKNITLRFIYRDRTKTLSLTEIENEHLRITKKIIEHLQEESK